MAARSEAERKHLGEALKDLVGERGYQDLTVGETCAHAGVEEAAFFACFGDLDECFAEVWEAADAELAEILEASYGEDGEWPRRLRATLEALLAFLDSDPDRARLYIAEVQLVSDQMRARRESAQARLAGYIERGSQGGESGAPEHAAAAVAGAIWYRLEARMRREEDGPLRAELPLMVYFAVLPYRGSEIAKAELRLLATDT